MKLDGDGLVVELHNLIELIDDPLCLRLMSDLKYHHQRSNATSLRRSEVYQPMKLQIFLMDLIVRTSFCSKDLLFKIHSIISRRCLIALCEPCHADRSASPPLGWPELLPHMDHGLTQIGNRQTFGFR